MKLITLSGLDGSGKSTQIKKLKQYLEHQGHKVKYFHIISFSIANKILTSQTSKIPGKARSITSAGGFKIFLRKIALVIDVFRFRKFFLTLSGDAETDFILADRCFCDQVANILYLERKSLPLKKLPLWFKLVENYVIVPDLKMYLRTSPNIILSRSREVDQGRQYLLDKEKIYDWLAQKWYLKLINGNQDEKNVFNHILEEYKNI